MKRLVVLFDGTWNKPGKEDETTNVVKLQRAIPAADAQRRSPAGALCGRHRHRVTSARLTFAVGAIGFGVGDRIRRGYRFLCENYEDGDEIYLIGFSRGAFQARSLAGLIALAGVARSAAPETIADVWDYYEQNKLAPDPARLEALRAAARYPVRIKCVGVWDTIGNPAFPSSGKALIKELLGFHDTQLSPLVDVGLHALAIDEPRGPFEPTLWTVKGAAPRCRRARSSSRSGSPAACQRRWRLSRIARFRHRAAVDGRADDANDGACLDLEHLRKTTKPDPLGELVSPTSDGIYRVSYLFPFVRLINQNPRAYPRLRRALLGNWRASIAPAGQTFVNESIHESAIARFGKRAPQRRGEALNRRKYRPMSLASVVRKRKRTR